MTFLEIVNDTNIYNLNKKVLNSSQTFMRYHADWCGHCQTLKPIWHKFESALKTDNDIIKGKYGHIVIGSVEEKNIKNMDKKIFNSINGFPTIVVLNEGNWVANYEGNRTVEDFIAFIKKTFKPLQPKRKHNRKHNRKHYSFKGSGVDGYPPYSQEHSDMGNSGVVGGMKPPRKNRRHSKRRFLRRTTKKSGRRLLRRTTMRGIRH